MMVDSGIPLGQWSGSDATDKLREAIEKIASDNDRLNRKMVQMTVAIVVLTVFIALLTAAIYWKTP